MLDLVRISSLSYWHTTVCRYPCCCWNGTKINWATRKAFLSRHAPSPDLSSVLNICRVWSRLRLHLHMQWGRGRMSPVATQHRPSGARHGSSGQGYSGELQPKLCMDTLQMSDSKNTDIHWKWVPSSITVTFYQHCLHQCSVWRSHKLSLGRVG